MNTEKLNSFQKIKFPFDANVKLQIAAGRFLIRTISSQEELQQAFLLRYQVFQVEMIGSQIDDSDLFSEQLRKKVAALSHIEKAHNDA